MNAHDDLRSRVERIVRDFRGYHAEVLMSPHIMADNLEAAIAAPKEAGQRVVVDYNYNGDPVYANPPGDQRQEGAVTTADDEMFRNEMRWLQTAASPPPEAAAPASGDGNILRRIRGLLSALPADCLGEGFNGAINWPIRDEVIADIDRALAAPTGPQPAGGGVVTVPREPTLAMFRAQVEWALEPGEFVADSFLRENLPDFRKSYHAMLDAAIKGDSHAG